MPAEGGFARLRAFPCSRMLPRRGGGMCTWKAFARSPWVSSSLFGARRGMQMLFKIRDCSHAAVHGLLSNFLNDLIEAKRVGKTIIIGCAWVHQLR